MSTGPEATAPGADTGAAAVGDPVVETDAPDGSAEVGPVDGRVADTAAEAQPWGWHALRVSGLFLAGLLAWHFVVTFVLHDVGDATAVTIAAHWRDTTWRALEWVTLVLALLHGGLGLDNVLRTWGARAVTAARLASGVVVGGLVVAVSIVVLGYR